MRCIRIISCGGGFDLSLPDIFGDSRAGVPTPPYRRQVKGTIQRAPAPPQDTRQEYPYHTRVCSLRSQMRSGRVGVATGEARMPYLTPMRASPRHPRATTKVSTSRHHRPCPYYDHEAAWRANIIIVRAGVDADEWSRNQTLPTR